MRISLLAAVLGVGLVAATITPPGGGRYFYQPTPPNPLPLQVLGRSHLSLLTDLLWIRAIGVSINLKVPADGLALISWCSFVTELDPRFVWPYILGGLLGPMPGAGNDWYNVKQADALLSRGMGHLPTDFRLPLYLSYNQLHLEHDAKAAAQTLRQGALIPGAPVFLGQLATRLLAQTDAYVAARTFALELEERSNDPDVRAFFEHRRKEIERDQVLAVLQKAVDAFRASRGQLPRSLLQLVSEGFLAEVPVDPLGGELLLSAEGTAFSTSGEKLKAHFQNRSP